MEIPSYLEAQVIDENGRFTPVWQRIMQQLLQELQINLSDEGIVMPSQSAANITVLTTAAVNGTLVYDSTNDLPKVNVAGVFKTILTA